MRNREVELDSKCCPCASVADVCFLDRWIGVEHRLSADLVDAGVDMPADVGQHGTFQVFVFEIDRSQVMLTPLFRSLLSQRVGIVEPVGGELVEGSIRIGRSLFIDWQIEDALPHANLRTNREWRDEQEQKRKLPSHRFHLEEYRSSIAPRKHLANLAIAHEGVGLLRAEEREEVKVLVVGVLRLDVTTPDKALIGKVEFGQNHMIA